MLKILGIASIVVLCGILAFPVATAGTFDPCEAAARIVARKTPKPDLKEPWATIAEEFAVKVGAAYARNHGIVACYRLIPVVMKMQDESSNRKFVRY
jgi:hypothetical protein